jgi:hypothetical protein
MPTVPDDIDRVAIGRQDGLDRLGDHDLILHDQDPQLRSSRLRIPERTARIWPSLQDALASARSSLGAGYAILT